MLTRQYKRLYQEGSFGKKEVVYKLTFEDGTQINNELVSETVSTQPKNRIIEVGTYVATDLSRVDEVVAKTDTEGIRISKKYALGRYKRLPKPNTSGDATISGCDGLR